MVVKDTTLVKRSWPLGVVTKVLPGFDGVVRVVDIRCNNKEYRRSANSLVLLFSSDQSNLPAREDVQGKSLELIEHKTFSCSPL